MQLRISAGTAVLSAAEFIEHEEALAPMIVDRPFLAFDFAELSHDESLAKVAEMEACVGMKIADADSDEVIRALTSLKRAIAGLRSDLNREYMIRARASLPTDTQSGSHPTLTGDAVKESAPQQSSEAVNDEENENGQAQEQQPVGRGRRGRR